MAVAVTHSFVSPVVDGGDPNLVGPDEWNAGHTVTGLGALALLATVGASQIDNDAVTFDKLLNAASASTLIGRRSGSTGNYEPVTLGANLAMSAGGELSATSGGGGDGSMTLNERTVSAAFTVDDAAPPPDGIINYDGPGSETGTMIDATANPGRVLEIKNTGAGQLAVDATGLGQIFVNGALADGYNLNSGEMISLTSVNGNWQLGHAVGAIGSSGGTISSNSLEFVTGAYINIVTGSFNIGGSSSASYVFSQLYLSERAVSAPGAVDDSGATDYLIVYTGAGTETETMLDANGYAGRVLQFKNAGSGNWTLDATALGQFFLAALQNTLTLAIGAAVGVQASNGAWQVMSSRGSVT